jgi:hypothetical protein
MIRIESATRLKEREKEEMETGKRFPGRRAFGSSSTD